MKHNHLPPRLFVQWHIITRVSKYNYPRAMLMAAAWGVALAEWEGSEGA